MILVHVAGILFQSQKYEHFTCCFLTNLAQGEGKVNVNRIALVVSDQVLQFSEAVLC